MGCGNKWLGMWTPKSLSERPRCHHGQFMNRRPSSRATARPLHAQICVLPGLRAPSGDYVGCPIRRSAACDVPAVVEGARRHALIRRGQREVHQTQHANPPSASECRGMSMGMDGTFLPYCSPARQ